MDDTHSQALLVLCRICGNLLETKYFKVSKYKTELKKAFNLNVDFR